ncbi:MAG: hypothetical protein J7K23_07790 [Thermoproteales archaeon]|nr:hypothetical protein [Thermoproteales archaeon]
MYQAEDLDIIYKILKNKINILDKNKERGTLIIRPSNSPFENIYISFKPIPLSLEKLTVFFGEIPIGEIGTDTSVIYKELKSLECEIDYKGFLGRKVLFISRKELVNLKDKLKGLKIRKDLTSFLNSDKDLLKEIKKLKIHRLEIKLNVGADVDSSLTEDIKDDIEKISQLYEISSFYNPPEDIYWNVIIEAYLVRGILYPKKVATTYQILENIGYKLINFTPLFLNRIS